ncbi:MAG: ATP-binding cassette domain-containing protein [Thermincola sp.]|jgi:ABC-2 type transport system ATP-binding protein|nr:ATP-binding cassette domain-containing protein [Thermincola sp.]MDT3702783.1 ATP-binding cassette domain-containing protein [Thermincola sp.]
MALIEVRGLTKEFKIFRRREGIAGAFRDLFLRDYRILRAVDGIDFFVNAGEMVGYIGANGAGKSTTIKMLTGILVPTAGEVVVDGYIPYKEREIYTRRIGVVFGQRTQLWWDIAVIESFKLLRRIYGVNKQDFEKRLKMFDDLLELNNFLHLPVRKLSLGQRMRCDLTAALLHNPAILFLDEPTIGLDVLAKAKIREFLQEINKEYKTTIILTTHDMGDIEALCPRVAIIDNGKMLYDGSVEDLYAQCGHDKLEDIVKGIYQGDSPELEAKDSTGGGLSG